MFIERLKVTSAEYGDGGVRIKAHGGQSVGGSLHYIIPPYDHEESSPEPTTIFGDGINGVPTVGEAILCAIINKDDPSLPNRIDINEPMAGGAPTGRVVLRVGEETVIIEPGEIDHVIAALIAKRYRCRDHRHHYRKGR